MEINFICLQKDAGSRLIRNMGSVCKNAKSEMLGHLVNSSSIIGDCFFEVCMIKLLLVTHNHNLLMYTEVQSSNWLVLCIFLMICLRLCLSTISITIVKWASQISISILIVLEFGHCPIRWARVFFRLITMSRRIEQKD